MKKIANYINGSMVEPSSGKYFENIDPSTGKAYSLIPDSDADDIDIAVQAAQKAFPEWSGMSLEKRSKYIIRLSEGIEKRMDEFVKAESLDNGKPVSLAAQVDIPRAVSNFHFLLLPFYILPLNLIQWRVWGLIIPQESPLE